MPEPDWDLDAWGLRLVLTLSDHLPPQAARRFAWGTAGDALERGRIVFWHWPIEDGPLPAWETAAYLADSVAAALALGWPVLIHCQEGRNRSGLLAALVVRTVTGCTGAEAVARVRAARPMCLANETFARALEALGPPR